MRRIKFTFLIATAAAAVLWIVSAWPFPVPTAFFPLRAAAVQLTGVLAIAAMSLAMILILRLRWIEDWLDGLDKTYRLHKWLGVGALVAGVTHWLWAQGPKWAGALGLGLTRPARTPPPPAVNEIETTFRALRKTAEQIGELAFYLAAALIVIALVKRIPYHWFRRTHLLLGPIYLALVAHSVILLDFANWASPIGVVTGALMAGGVVAAFASIFRRIGAGRKVVGEVVSVDRFPALGVVAATLSAPDGWPGHRAGQFVFATSDPWEGAHPYTIASAWDGRGKTIRLIAKALGDHTRRVVDTLTPGTRVTIEGPYGRFIFEDHAPLQIWVGAGIGVTPFVARLEALAAERAAGRRSGQRVVMFHSTAQEDDAALSLLRRDAAAAGVELHVLVDKRDGFLTGARIRELAPQWREASLWFCGPARFCQSLREDFSAQGFDVGRRFHHELFEMR